MRVHAAPVPSGDAHHTAATRASSMLARAFSLGAMVLSNVLGVVILVADPPTQAVAPAAPASMEVATDPVVVAEPPVTTEPALAAEPMPELAPAYDSAPMPEPEPEPEPEGTPPQTRWRGGPYLTMGVAPMVTMDVHAHTHPGLRYDMEVGMAWKRGRARVFFGPDFHLMQYFGRKKLAFGVDAVTTFTLRHVYARAGVGTAMGVPAGPDVRDTRPMVGGLLGAGLVGRLDKVEGRLGVDYDVRVDTAGRVAQTMLLTLRMTFGP